MVLGTPSPEHGSLIDWMWHTLAHATDELICEWRICLSRDPLRESLEGVWRDLNKKLNGSDGRRVFSCWPTIIRASGQANCVGRSLIAARLLDRLEIPHFIAIMPFHVVNVVPLGDAWLYADLANGVFEMRGATIHERRDGRILSFDEPVDLFQTSLLSPPSALVYLVLCNLIGVKLVGENLESQAQCPDSLEREARITVYREYREYLAACDLAAWVGKLFPAEDALMADPLMEEESERVRILLRKRFLGRDAPFST